MEKLHRVLRSERLRFTPGLSVHHPFPTAVLIDLLSILISCFTFCCSLYIICPFPKNPRCPLRSCISLLHTCCINTPLSFNIHRRHIGQFVSSFNRLPQIPSVHITWSRRNSSSIAGNNTYYMLFAAPSFYDIQVRIEPSARVLARGGFQ